MASTNIKIFDENKANMKSDGDYAIDPQRLMGVQSGVASSQLQNKTLYQTTLVANAIAQMMVNNGYNANDSDAVSTFVNNLSSTVLQKVLDKGTITDVYNEEQNKFVSPYILNTWVKSSVSESATSVLRQSQALSRAMTFNWPKITNGFNVYSYSSHDVADGLALGIGEEHTALGVGLGLLYFAKMTGYVDDGSNSLASADNLHAIFGYTFRNLCSFQKLPPYFVTSDPSHSQGPYTATMEFEVNQVMLDDLTAFLYYWYPDTMFCTTGFQLNSTQLTINGVEMDGPFKPKTLSDLNITSPGTYTITLTTSSHGVSNFGLVCSFVSNVVKNKETVYDLLSIPTLYQYYKRCNFLKLLVNQSLQVVDVESNLVVTANDILKKMMLLVDISTGGSGDYYTLTINGVRIAKSIEQKYGFSSIIYLNDVNITSPGSYTISFTTTATRNKSVLTMKKITRGN